VKTPGILQRHPELRWLAVIAVIVAAAAVIATSLSGVFRKDSALPVTGPQQLVSELRAPHSGGYSGTIDAQVDLRLPPQVSAAFATVVPAGALLRGSHRLRYWYGDAAHQRVAVINDTSEQDVFRQGSRVWEWDTATQIARRSTVAATPAAALPLGLTSAADLAPPVLAKQLVDLLGSSSDLALRSGDPVGNRPTYQLVLTPESTTTRIGEVEIDLDGREGVPLRVRVYSLAGGQPVVDVAFEDDISFAQPSGRNFAFSPPPGALVHVGAHPTRVVMLGDNWQTVAEYRTRSAAVRRLARTAESLPKSAAQRVKGKWGTGRLVVTPAVTMLITDRGRVFAGPVAPVVLYRVAG
jgi:hypothetical protein